jgi:tetratricopeptide (TPR) repeat protein
LLDQARQLDPNLPASYEVAGLLADADGKMDEARAAYAKAIELGSTNFYPYHRWAALTGRPADAAVRAQIERAFTRAIELNSSFMPSHALLADLKTQLGHPDEALALATRAVSLEPGRTQGRLALARALLALSRIADAQEEAREGLAVAVSDIEKTNAQQLIDRLGRQANAAAR